MVWRILLTRLRKHSIYHLIIPLAGGIMVEALIERFIGENNIIVSLIGLGRFRTLSLVAGVFASYLLVMYFLIRQETRKRIPERARAKLQDICDVAKSYYGVSIIPLTEWFDPGMQVYLAKLLNHKLEPDGFEHERTLLFFSNREYEHPNLCLMDEEHYGKCLALMHADCDIPLSFLNRKEIFEVLDKLSCEEKEALGCYPRWTNWPILSFFRRLPLRWLRRQIEELDFGVIVRANDDTRVLRVSKHGDDVRIKEEIKGDPARPYIKLMKLIKEQVYDPETHTLRFEHDFVRSYGYEARIRTRQIQQELAKHGITTADDKVGVRAPTGALPTTARKLA
jgi:hypothetical protein